MGLLRLALALIVVAHHIPHYIQGNHSFGNIMSLLDGMVCVPVFFIISGFYMSMVINEKYAKSERFLMAFFAGRVLRLFPLYLFVLAASVLYSLAASHDQLFAAIADKPYPAMCAQVFMNLTTLGLDLVPSFGQRADDSLASQRLLAASSILLLALIWRLLDPGSTSDPDAARLWLFYAALTILIPQLFLGWKNSRLDQLLGSLSYPIYISHALVLTFVADHAAGSQGSVRLWAFGGSIAIGVLLAFTIEGPRERRRLAATPHGHPPRGSLPVASIILARHAASAEQTRTREPGVGAA